jgi:hypothetical protein
MSEWGLYSMGVEGMFKQERVSALHFQTTRTLFTADSNELLKICLGAPKLRL